MDEFQLNPHAPFAETLGVIAQVPHWTGTDGRLRGYEPYVREMRIWADLFARVIVCAPPGAGPARGNLAAYERANIRVMSVTYSLEAGWPGIRRRLGQFPGMFRDVYRLIRNSDFVLVRSPNHFATAGAVLLRGMRRTSITKWAGENGAYAGEKISLRINRLLESRGNSRSPVLVYGQPKSPHQIEFLPALMSADELKLARDLARRRVWRAPWQLVSVGRLEPVKGFDLALRGLGELGRAVDWHYTLVGDGTARRDLERLATECGIADRVTFTGALPFDKVQEHYAASHIAIMPGTMEGWPKVIAEAWAHGAVPVACAGGLVPWILRDKNTGVVVAPNPAALATGLRQLLDDPVRLQAMSAQGFPCAEALSLEQFKARLEQVLRTRCGLK